MWWMLIHGWRWTLGTSTYSQFFWNCLVVLCAIPCIVHMQLHMQDEEHQFDYSKEPLDIDVVDNPPPKQFFCPSLSLSPFKGVACAHDCGRGSPFSVWRKHGASPVFLKGVWLAPDAHVLGPLCDPVFVSANSIPTIPRPNLWFWSSLN